MKALAITAAVLLALWLIGRIRIGARLEYGDGGFFLWLKLGAMHIQLVPQKKSRAKKEKKPKRAKESKKTEEPQPQKRGGSLAAMQQLLPVALDALGYLRRKLRADVLRMRLTVAADDPADAAVRYGGASALLGALWRPLTEALHVVDGQAQIDVDFQAVEPVIYLLAQLTLTVGQALTLAVVYGLKALAALLRARGDGRAAIQGKAEKRNGTKAPDQ